MTKKKKIREEVLAPWECSARRTGFARSSSPIRALLPKPNAHKHTWKSARNKSQDSTRTHPETVINLRLQSPPPPSPPLCFWLCLHAGRRSPDTHRWVSPLHINATYSPIRSPICAFPPTLPALKSNLLCEQAPPNRRLKVNHASSGCFFF